MGVLGAMTVHRSFASLVLLAVFASGGLASAAEIDQKCEKLLGEWKGRLEEENFKYVVAPPFVIAGDGGAEALAAYRDRTILAATRCLQKQFFSRKPGEPVLILLFETQEPYRRLARKWFGDGDVPYYGYFRHDNVMLMNVGTGTGTLVHELTHALIKPDFPQVPSWFNEGLASLYEQCSLGADDTIKGHENWRLPGLQKAISAGKLRPLAKMIADPKFYREDLLGVNYAQARYLMFYLQEKGLLVKYYQTFRDGVKEDGMGLASLKEVIAPRSLEEFEREWRAWVMTLNFRAR
jgi:hypothetical protein